MNCRGCRFYSPPGQAASPGQCRKAPPLVLVGQAAGLAAGQVRMSFHSYWPPVAADEWCGAWSAKPAGMA